MTMVKRLPNKMLPLTSTLAYTILLLEGVHAFPAAGGGSNGASAQMTFTNLYIDRQDQGAGTCIRPSNSAGPWEIDNGMLTSCGEGGSKGVPRVCTVPPGSMLSFGWHSIPADETSPGVPDPIKTGRCGVSVQRVHSAIEANGRNGDKIEKPGGFMRVMNKVADTARSMFSSRDKISSDPAKAEWKPLIRASKNKKCVENMRQNGGRFSFTLPKELPGGYYLIRPEVEDTTASKGAQFAGCAQIYIKTDERAVSPQREGILPKESVLENANWWGLEVPAYKDQSGCLKAFNSCRRQGKDCYNLAGATGPKNCAIWDAKCAAIGAQCNPRMEDMSPDMQRKMGNMIGKAGLESYNDVSQVMAMADATGTVLMQGPANAGKKLTPSREKLEESVVASNLLHRRDLVGRNVSTQSNQTAPAAAATSGRNADNTAGSDTAPGTTNRILNLGGGGTGGGVGGILGDAVSLVTSPLQLLGIGGQGSAKTETTPVTPGGFQIPARPPAGATAAGPGPLGGGGPLGATGGSLSVSGGSLGAAAGPSGGQFHGSAGFPPGALGFNPELPPDGQVGAAGSSQSFQFQSGPQQQQQGFVGFGGGSGGGPSSVNFQLPGFQGANFQGSGFQGSGFQSSQFSPGGGSFGFNGGSGQFAPSFQFSNTEANFPRAFNFQTQPSTFQFEPGPSTQFFSTSGTQGQSGQFPGSFQIQFRPGNSFQTSSTPFQSGFVNSQGGTFEFPQNFEVQFSGVHPNARNAVPAQSNRAAVAPSLGNKPAGAAAPAPVLNRPTSQVKPLSQPAERN